MADLRSFNAGRGNSHYDLVPNGKYVAEITKSAVKPTKSGTGRYLLVTFRILNGPHANQLLSTLLNFCNPSADAVRYAYREYDAICRALGMQRPNDSAELHNRPLEIHVGSERRSDNQELTNVIVGYSAVQSANTARSQ